MECQSILEHQETTQVQEVPFEKSNESCFSVVVNDPELKDTLNEVEQRINRI